MKQPYQPEACPQCGLETKAGIPFCQRCRFDLRYGSINKPKRGKCIYCDNTNLTDEHILPDWLSKAYPDAAHKVEMNHTLRRPSRIVFEGASELYKETPPPSLIGIYGQQVRNVCAQCNNGWMSLLTNQVKDIVNNLSDGNWRVLTHDEREIFSRWAAMVSINLECFARMLATTEHQRLALKNGSMPDGWRVCIGLLGNRDFAGLTYNSSIPVPIHVREDDHFKLQNTFFCVENLVVHTLSSINDHCLDLAKYWAVQMQLPTALEYVWPLDVAMSESIKRRLNGVDIQNLFKFSTA